MNERTLPNGVIERWQWFKPLYLGEDLDGEPIYDLDGGYMVRWDFNSRYVPATMNQATFDAGGIERMRDAAVARLLS